MCDTTTDWTKQQEEVEEENKVCRKSWPLLISHARLRNRQMVRATIDFNRARRRTRTNMSKFGLVVCLLENFGEGMCYFGGLFNFQLRTAIHYGSHVPVVITIKNFTTTHVPIVASE